VAGQHGGAVGQEAGPVVGDDGEVDGVAVVDRAGDGPHLVTPQRRVAHGQVTGQHRGRLGHEPQRRRLPHEGSGATGRNARQFEQLGDLRRPRRGRRLVVLGHLHLDQVAHHLAERARIGQQPRVPAADEPALGADGGAERVERVAGDDRVALARQGEDGELAGPQLGQLDRQVGGAGQFTGPDQRDRVRHHVGDEVAAHRLEQLDPLGQRQELAGEPQRPVPRRPGAEVDAGAAADRVQEDEVADPLREVVGELDGDTAAERVADDEGGLVDAGGRHELVHPGRVPGDRHRPVGQVGAAGEAGHRRGVHPAAAVGEPAHRPLVGVVAQRPPVQEEDGRALAAHAVRRPPVLDLDRVPLEVGSRTANRLRQRGRPKRAHPATVARGADRAVSSG
jgi:hypothetical protein